jgi:uncharacterized protein DUF4386
VDAHANGLVIDEMFFGLWLVPLGYLVIRSRQIPWVVGVLVAAMSWIGQFLANLLSPGRPYVFVVGQVGGAGELSSSCGCCSSGWPALNRGRQPQAKSDWTSAGPRNS